MGIAKEMYRLAEREQQIRPNAHWAKLLDDQTSKRRYALLHFQALTDDVILSLIKGTLPSDLTKNPELRSFVTDCMQPKNGPSIYIMAPASSVQSILVAGGAPTPRLHAGRWLSPDQARTFFATCEDYHTRPPQAAAAAATTGAAATTVPGGAPTTVPGGAAPTTVPGGAAPTTVPGGAAPAGPAGAAPTTAPGALPVGAPRTLSAAAIAMNKAIDAYPSLVPIAKEQKFKTQVSDKWLQSMKDIYDDPTIPANKRSTPWSRVPMEVGYAKHTITRLQQHAGNRSTNALFGLTHAILRLPNRPPMSQGFGFPKPRQWELFPLHNDDEQYAQIGEIVGSLLCSSYHSMGGLNPTYAGTASHSVADVPSSTWDDQALNLATRIQRADYPNVEIRRFAARKKDLEALQSWKAKRDVCEEKEQKLKEAKQKRAEHEQEWIKANRRLGELRKELEKLEEQNAAASQSPLVKDLYELNKRCKENELVDQFSEVKLSAPLGAAPDWHITAMEEQGIPDHIRARVIARVEQDEKAASQRIQDIFGVKPSPKARKPVPTTRPPQFEKVIIDLDENLQMGEDDQDQLGEPLDDSLSSLALEELEEDQEEENGDIFEISEQEVRPHHGEV